MTLGPISLTWAVQIEDSHTHGREQILLSENWANSFTKYPLSSTCHQGSGISVELQLSTPTPFLCDLIVHAYKKLGTEVNLSNRFLWCALQSAETPPLLAATCPRFPPLESHSFGLVSCGEGVTFSNLPSLGRALTRCLQGCLKECVSFSITSLMFTTVLGT